MLLILSGGVSFAQLAGSAEKSAFRNMEKHRWQKAEAKLRKELGKDSLNPSIRHALSIFYFHPDNPDYNLDSAYHYAVSALTDYTLTPLRGRERLRRAFLDSTTLLAHRRRIDSVAFQVAKKSNTEAAYLHFLSHFPLAAQRSLAMDLRDEVAYQDALKTNTYQAFHAFLARYPQAGRAGEARANYDRLLYFEKTKDQRLVTFETFLARHPETPFREEIYRHIFQISTAGGEVESFLSFIAKYPGSDLVKKARQLVFHILAGEEEPEWPAGFLSDSLENVLSLNKTYLVPVLKNNRYGFIDESGREIISPRFESIDASYLCGQITDDVLVADRQLVARNGEPIYSGIIEEVADLGTGFLKVVAPAGVSVIHKAGFAVADSLTDARVLAKRYLALKKDRRWFLYTLTGKLLDSHPWDDIRPLGDVMVFKSGNKMFLVPAADLGKIADGHPLALSKAFEEVKPWPHDLIWTRSAGEEAVYDQALKPVMPPAAQILTETFFGAYAHRQGGYTIYNWEGHPATGFEKINVSGKWVMVKKNGSWLLFDPVFRQIESKPYDTIRAEGAFVVGRLTDTLYVHFRGNRIRMFPAAQGVSFIPGMDTTSFLVVQEERGKTVYDLHGRRMFSADFESIAYGGDGVFVITRKNKKGLLSASGETILPAEFDAIGSAQHGVVSLLKNKHFGCYQIKSKKLIPPQYERNLHRYSETQLTCYRDGFYGFLGWDNKPLSKCEFEEIRYWSDSAALVRKGMLWSLYDIPRAVTTAEGIRNFRTVKSTEQETVAIIQKDNNFGVISNRQGLVVPVSFSDIVNLGSSETPFYFTEKQVREAALFVVIYYDHAGTIVRKEIYEEPAEYDRIYCSDN